MPKFAVLLVLSVLLDVFRHRPAGRESQLPYDVDRRLELRDAVARDGAGGFYEKRVRIAQAVVRLASR